MILQIWLVWLLFCYGFAFWGLLAIWYLVARCYRLFRFSWFTLNLDAVILVYLIVYCWCCYCGFVSLVCDCCRLLGGWVCGLLFVAVVVLLLVRLYV